MKKLRNFLDFQLDLRVIFEIIWSVCILKKILLRMKIFGFFPKILFSSKR